MTTAFLAMAFIVGATWIGVANAAAAFKPPSWGNLALSQEDRETVSGNGGPAVMVGNWLYFVGNHVDTSTIRFRENEHNKVEYGAIYRVFIDPKVGMPLYEDEDKWRDTLDYTRHRLDEKQFHLVVPKVAGFDQAALWIFGDHLIYTSPNNERNKMGQLQLGKIDFYRVNLDGRNHRRIYTTSNEMVTTNDFTVGSFLGNVYVLIKDGDMLRRVSVNRNPGSVVTVSDRVQNLVALPIVTSYGQIANNSLSKSYEGIMEHVYYTETLSEDEQKLGLQGNRIYQYNVRLDKKTDAHIPHRNIEVLALSNGRLMYTITHVNGDRHGLYRTTEPIQNQNGAFKVESMDTFNLLPGARFHSSETVHLPTEITLTDFWFVTLEGGRMHIYEEGKLNTNYITIQGVSRIINITSSTIHYLDSAGVVRSVRDKGEGFRVDKGLGELSPGTSIRPWVINDLWYFHIKTLESSCDDHDDHDHDHGSYTVAVISDISSGVGNERNFLLGRIDCVYIEGNHDDC